MSARSFLARYGAFPLALLAVLAHAQSNGWPRSPRFRVLALAERASGDHQSFVDAAKIYLNKLAGENDFAVDYITTTISADGKAILDPQLED